MLMPHQIEELIVLVGAMDRPTLARQFGEFRAGFPLDFTPEFLRSASLDRLRHIYVALCLQCQQMPQVEEEETDVLAPTAA